MSKRYIRKADVEKARTLSAFDYMKNYQPDMLVKNGRTDYFHRGHYPIFSDRIENCIQEYSE